MSSRVRSDDSCPDEDWCLGFEQEVTNWEAKYKYKPEEQSNYYFMKVIHTSSPITNARMSSASACSDHSPGIYPAMQTSSKIFASAHAKYH
jgi:hypothetical protein